MNTIEMNTQVDDQLIMRIIFQTELTPRQWRDKLGFEGNDILAEVFLHVEAELEILIENLTEI